MRMKEHYYPCDNPVDKHGYGKTACGRSGYILRRGFIAAFFKMVDQNKRCKICNKRFKKDRKEKNVKN